MPKIYDNIKNHLSKGLNETLDLSHRADFCVGYFNLRGWKEVSAKIESLVGNPVIEGKNEEHRYCRLLVGMQTMPADQLRDYFSQETAPSSQLNDLNIDNKEANKKKRQLAIEFREQLTIGAPSERDEKSLRKLSEQLKSGKLVVKLHLKHSLHAKLYLAYSDDKRVPIVGFLGSSNLTLAGLSKQGELNIDVLEQDAADKLAQWFDDRWNDRLCVDITKELIDVIDNSWAADRIYHPYHIYLKIAYYLSREARAGINEFKLPKVFQRELLDFQQKAVLIAAHHLHKRNGVMIGDVVGLGKTITATALAKIFEDDFFLETLIICPVHLMDMWEHYAHKYQLRAKIISESNVQNTLQDLRRYRQVIIDESHNLRNDQAVRYRAIKSYLEENECKVILLTATPYNKSYVDLSNQLRLFIPDDLDLGISPENYISRIGGPIEFTATHTETFIRSIKAFEKSDSPDDWRELMRLYLVRRTRSFIKNNYARKDPDNGRYYLTFADGTRSYMPDRTPKKVEFEFNKDDINDQYAQLYSNDVVDIINSLELPRYGLGNFRDEKPKIKPNEKEEIVLSNLSRAGKRLMGFCRTNLFKRLESSGHAFLLTLSRHLLRNYIFIYAAQNNLELPVGKNLSQNLDEYLEDSDIDSDEDEINTINLEENFYLTQAQKIYEKFSSADHRYKFDWIRSGFFGEALMKNLISDSREILKILSIGQNWNPGEDRKINSLYDLLTKKHPKEKVLIFTQFSDTATYLENELIKRGLKSLSSATGASKGLSDIVNRFSPGSNDVSLMADDRELRILIATDVLSEGQNLQDAHIVLNYDLPWAIIRLIQRAGRVDRIGQKAEQILCYSFLPEEGIEQIIGLRTRLTNRIKQNAEVVGSDETFFDGDPVNIHDLYNERSGILDDEEDAEVDLASYAYQIWNNAIELDPTLKKIIPDLPNVVYATKTNATKSNKDGVIVYARTSDDHDSLAWLDSDSKIITQSQLSILRAAECSPNTEPLNKLEHHHLLVQNGIKHIREEEMKNTEGTLGKKSGVKYRVYMRLDRYCLENDDTSFVTDELKKAISDIYKYPLKDFARDTLNRQLKSGISDQELVDLVVSLREDDKLCITSDIEEKHKEPQIICSLGLMNSK
jgi:superfamily II DNA or RNA helicase